MDSKQNVVYRKYASKEKPQVGGCGVTNYCRSAVVVDKKKSETASRNATIVPAAVGLLAVTVVTPGSTAFSSSTVSSIIVQ